MPKNQSNAPERIYLHDSGDDPGHKLSLDNYTDLEEISWGVKAAHDDDTQYVRADLYAVAGANDREFIYAALMELGARIEACGASLELTHAVTLCSDLRSAIGNKWNLVDKYARGRVLTELSKLKSA